jgi:hypothetical protein
MKKDLTGQRFGRLVVLEEAGRNKHGDLFLKCKCDCGNVTIARSGNIRRGHTTSCGCYAKEVRARRFRDMTTIHGGSKTRLYSIWKKMIFRCEKSLPPSPSYRNYRGRGITVCREWHSYPVFRDWAQTSGYRGNLTIDRIDNDKGYSPDNCRWATYKEQGANRRNTVNFNGLCVAEWARILNVPSGTFYHRRRLGWVLEKVIRTPVQSRHLTAVQNIGKANAERKRAIDSR